MGQRSSGYLEGGKWSVKVVGSTIPGVGPVGAQVKGRCKTCLMVKEGMEIAGRATARLVEPLERDVRMAEAAFAVADPRCLWQRQSMELLVSRSGMRSPMVTEPNDR